MAKDYFQDILPPQSGSAGKLPRSMPPPGREEKPEGKEDFSVESPEPMNEGRSIRNITVSPRNSRRPMEVEREMPPPPRRKAAPRIWVWFAAVVLVAILGLIFLVAMRPSSISVVPRSQVVVFDSSMQFTAYPEGSASGTLVYAIHVATFDDSKVVTASGSEYAESKATGKITVFNDYSTDPVRLIATTRFETPDGLIFRTPEDVSVPGKKGTTPGQLVVSVEADKAGDQYNVGPVSKLTIPGLKGNAAMYESVYARSDAPMSGGFAGNRPAVSASDEESARAEIRNRLEQKVQEVVSKMNTDTSIVFPGLVQTTFSSLPTISDGGDAARVRESVQAILPVFPSGAFAQTVAQGVSADAEQSSVFIKNTNSLAASFVADEMNLGSNPIVFSISGTAQIVWNIDTSALADALAGRDQGAFEAIVASFPGIDEARARIQPFWKKTFPTDPKAIQIRLKEPKVLDAS